MAFDFPVETTDVSTQRWRTGNGRVGSELRTNAPRIACWLSADTSQPPVPTH